MTTSRYNLAGFSTYSAPHYRKSYVLRMVLRRIRQLLF